MTRAAPPDSKLAALAASGTVNPHAQDVQDPAFLDNDFFDRRDLVQVRYEMLRRVMNGWRSYAPTFFGDYYPLTAYSLDPKLWMAWQFDCPERGEGMVQVFRRPQSVYESARFTLSGLAPDARYALVDIDGTQKFDVASGRDLAERGVVIAVPDRPGAVVVTYKRVE